jgi:hypothetical protein
MPRVISRQKLFHRLKSFSFLVGLVMLFNVNSASADVHLSVQVSDPLAFRDYFWLDGEFGGLLSDFIELADGTYNIEVFGPPGQPPFPLHEMFYTLTVGVEVVKSKPEVRSVSFNSYCASKGIQSRIKEWPAPVIMRDGDFPGAFRLLIENPIITKRDTPCTPPANPSMAPWADIGVLKLITTSTPAGAEVWVGGRVIGKTNSTIKVPYRDKRDKIDVVIRMPGYVNCRWTLEGPFEGEARLHCIPKTP